MRNFAYGGTAVVTAAAIAAACTLTSGNPAGYGQGLRYDAVPGATSPGEAPPPSGASAAPGVGANPGAHPQGRTSDAPPPPPKPIPATKIITKTVQAPAPRITVTSPPAPLPVHVAPTHTEPARTAPARIDPVQRTPARPTITPPDTTPPDTTPPDTTPPDTDVPEAQSTATSTTTVTEPPSPGDPGVQSPGDPGAQVPGDPGVQVPGDPGVTSPGDPGATSPGDPDAPQVASDPATTVPIYTSSAGADCAVSKCIALTFSGGPGPETRQFLQVLQAHGAHATFFVTGAQVTQNADVVAAIAGSGNEIGNGTFSQPDMTTLSAADQATELRETDDAVRSATGIEPTLFRPMGGHTSSDVVAAGKRQGLTEVLWDLDTQDYSDQSDPSAVAAAIERAKPGQIVMLHDTFAASATGLDQALTVLAKKGYVFVTASQLLGSRR
ncbi:polysaccharide deacetylase family protein [Tsukamurella soli]|uniref:polysaccharide deacetylase family protein n=1 Tax=Tsukamurella soli TaxID=644556 RepID=UPI0031F1A558